MELAGFHGHFHGVSIVFLTSSDWWWRIMSSSAGYCFGTIGGERKWTVLCSDDDDCSPVICLITHLTCFLHLRLLCFFLCGNRRFSSDNLWPLQLHPHPLLWSLSSFWPKSPFHSAFLTQICRILHIQYKALIPTLTKSVFLKWWLLNQFLDKFGCIIP